ncbi:MAG: hypothetical protein AB1425_15270 [Actinomycetota bacterium]
MDRDAQKKLVAYGLTALAAWAATRLAGSLLDQPEERGARDDLKEALLQGAFSVGATVLASWVIRNILVGRRR